MARAYKWIIAGLAIAGLVALWLFLRSRGNKPAADRVLADVFTVQAKQRIEETKQRIDKLAKQEQVDLAAVSAAQADLEEQQVRLTQRYEQLGLTPEAIAHRFDGLRI